MIIRGNNIDVTEALQNFIEKKFTRFKRYFDAVVEITVVLSVIKGEHKIEVTLSYEGLMIRAEETSMDMYASIDMVVEKIERQIHKNKTKVTRKLRQEGSLRTHLIESALNPVYEAVLIADEEEPFEVVRTKKFNFKPMNTEEAILQMNMLGHDFYVFTNSLSEHVNVIYKRKDGKYALIEPD